MRTWLCKAREWVLAQMGATADSPWREEPHKWDQARIRAWMIQTARRFDAKALFLLMEGNDGVLTHLVINREPDSVVRGVADAVKGMADQHGIVVDIGKPGKGSS